MGSFLDRVLEPPSYGFEKEGRLSIPTSRQLFGEFFRRMNVFETRRNWLALFGWVTTLLFAVPFYFHFARFFDFRLAIAGFVYSMVVLGSYGTFWFHRYGTHRAFRFNSKFVRFLCRNAVVKVVPEEAYIISHYVHHQFSEEPGDPYNVHAGWLYCFLADVNHQGIRKDLSEKEYAQLCKLLDHVGVHVNSYAQYRRWGSMCHPAFAILHYVLNWAFWYAVFYSLGGNALACALFGWTGVWAIGIRTFNFEGHGKGKDRRREGIDFNREDLSVNQVWPGYVAGEWHNNHHLYPTSARCGFLPYQLDIPWLAIRSLRAVGAVSAVRDFREDFLRDHYRPYREGLASAVPEASSANETA